VTITYVISIAAILRHRAMRRAPLSKRGAKKDHGASIANVEITVRRHAGANPSGRPVQLQCRPHRLPNEAVMGSTNTEGATRRADWQAFCAHGQAEAAAIQAAHRIVARAA